MAAQNEYRVGEEDRTVICFHRGGPAAIEIDIECDDTFFGLRPTLIPLGKLLRTLGFTADDCARALAEDTIANNSD